MSSWFQMCNSEAKGALRMCHWETRSVSLTLIIFFMSCSTPAVLLHYLHYAVSLSHKQIHLKIRIVKVQKLLEDIAHPATLNVHWKLLTIAGNILNFLLISLFPHLFLDDLLSLIETLNISAMPAKSILKSHIIKFSYQTRFVGDIQCMQRES